MKIEKIPIDQINPAPYNPRRDLKPGDKIYEQLKRSIEEFGIVQLGVWNKKTGNLVGGHQTFKILKAKGRKSFDCAVIDVVIKKEIALNQALNKIRGEWDHKKLAETFKMIEKEDPGFDFTVTGFSMSEIDGIKIKFGMEKKPEVEFSEILDETNEYVVLIFANEIDWLAALTHFGLKPVRANLTDTERLRKSKKYVGMWGKGTGRVIDGAKYLKRIQEDRYLQPKS